ncbi:DNA repair ATPase [Streptomyces sp900116325]|uniref:DNA repair ATPase n=1 Tax=Streptomyces sp. 900116325 TaxID=3154295 RepID=A0ABV2UAP3_9ACTN
MVIDPTPTVDAGTYDVLRRRLAAHAAELARRAEALNARRTEAFGSTELRLLATEQIRTEQPSLPRDLVAVGGQLLFGFERGPGARGEATVADVLALYGPDLAGSGDTLLADEAFVREFIALHRYYRDARLLRLRRVDGRLLAVFRTGETADDIRVLRWALAPDGSPGPFLDARGDRDHVFPPSHDFTWTPAGRESHLPGRHPHIAIGDSGALFVDTLGGTLTVKTVDDTDTPDGIYEEPVTEPLQSLADAAVEYAEVGPLILLRIRPYNEDSWRHLVFNSLLSTVQRLDAIGPACHRLPEDQGIIFPGGTYLTTGTAKTFDLAEPLADPVFEGAVRSPNGEDVLYLFRSRDGGRGLLLPYNLIRQEVAAPLLGRGHALLDDGTLVLLKDTASAEPARVHAVQRWRTPYVSDTYAASRPAGTGPLARVGNADLVRGISDCLALAHSAAKTSPTAAVYGQLVTDCTRANDRYHWLADHELGFLASPLTDLRDTAQQVLTEFETVRELTRQAADALAESADRITALVRRIRGEAPRSAAAWVSQLTELRRVHGHLGTLAEMRYADTERIAALTATTVADIGSAAQRAVAFLSRDDAFTGYHQDIDQLTADAAALATVVDAAALGDRLTEMTDGLATVTDVVTGLEIGDGAVRTSILERIAEVLGGANRARATLDARRRELLDHEGRAEFAAEFALLGQAVTGALAAADSPDACDGQLARLLLQLENLESRFAEFDDFLAQLSERRTEVYEAFSARKQTLQDARARRAERLAQSAARVLETVSRRLSALLGSHPRIDRGRLTVRLDELLARTAEFRTTAVPGFRAYQRQRTTLVGAERARLRLDDHRPRVMSAFVRNQFIDEVYLPMIGDSLAKQLGTADADRRTDSQGLLLLVSPPGYGKTTLMEYVADRLGLVLVKVSGPSLGREVTSLDPAQARSATARHEIEKINFALEAGNNTLLHLDDIQHTSPELLQKFIPLCDATRRVEGVRDGEPRSYDLRGKRFAVCMTGNPYTESGEQFRIPDMLANRADVWNLGEVLSGREDVFALSFVENALTANPVLAPLAGRSREDLALLVRLASGAAPSPIAHADRLDHPYPPAELDRIVSVLRHLLTARSAVLAVNAAYIASAAQTEATRTEPSFRLQGSYRNMNKIAERIVPVMNDAELAAVIDDHYAGEAQTLTTGAESNLLKLAALRGTLTAEQTDRWAAITASYVRAQALGGPDSGPMTRAVAALGLLADRIAAVEAAIRRSDGPITGAKITDRSE